ncbi:MAG: polysaccharide biosynthesis/export family protein [Nitrospirota bacterium]
MHTHRRKVYLVILLLLFAGNRIASADAYLIGAEDMLHISVWGNPELSVHVPVRPDGMVSMPLIGDVKAEGKTPLELKKDIEKDLLKYVKAPVVSVTVTAINSFKVYVFGDGVSKSTPLFGENSDGNTGTLATSSGQIALKRNTTLLQLLAQIGSPSNIDLVNAYLLRGGEKLTVDFEQLVSKGDYSQDVKLEPNDIIYLPGGFSNRIRVSGAVRAPGVIQYSEGMTTLDAVLAAGGFTEFASQNSVLVARKEGKSIKNFKVKLKDVMHGDLAENFPLRPGDVVTVTTSWF